MNGKDRLSVCAVVNRTCLLSLVFIELQEAPSVATGCLRDTFQLWTQEFYLPKTVAVSIYIVLLFLFCKSAE